VLTDAEAQAALAGGRGPGADDVAFGAGGDGVPARLVLGVPHVVVVVVDAHGEEVLCTRFDVKVHEVIGVPVCGFELRDQIFVADLGGVTVGFDVVVVLAGALDVHVAGVPVAVFDAGLWAPVGPDAELRVVEPSGKAVGLEGRWGPGEGAGGEGDLVLLGVGGAEGRSCSGKESERLAACDSHDRDGFSYGDRLPSHCSVWVGEMQVESLAAIAESGLACSLQVDGG
jgi:hypothetical protein